MTGKWKNYLPDKETTCPDCPIFKALAAVFRHMDEEDEIRLRDELRKMNEDPYP